MIDFSQLGKPKEEYPKFTREYESPIKALVVEYMPEYPDWKLVNVSVYLENGNWMIDKMAIMDLKEVMEIANEKDWFIFTSGFMQKLQS